MPAKTRKKRKPAPVLLRRLRKHFGADPADLPVIEYQVVAHERPNLHLAVEELLSQADRQADLLGVVGEQDYHQPSLARLSREKSARYFDQGPVQYVEVDLPSQRRLSCVKTGLYLIRDKKEPLA